MPRINYKSIFKAYIPIGIILFLILKSELRTEGTFGGIMEYFKYIFFLLFGTIVFIYTIVRQGQNLRIKTKIKEAKIILILLFISTFVAIGSFWFPKDFFDKESNFIAKGHFGTELKLFVDGKYMLRTRDYEWTTIDRGKYQLINDTILLDDKVKEQKWSKRTGKYLIKNEHIIPIYSDGIEKDSIDFMLVKLDKNSIESWE